MVTSAKQQEIQAYFRRSSFLFVQSLVDIEVPKLVSDFAFVQVQVSYFF